MKRVTGFVLSWLFIVMIIGCEGIDNQSLAGERVLINKTKNDSQIETSPQPAPNRTLIPSLDPNQKSTLVFSMFKRDPYFELAASNYMKAHPNTKIELDYVISDSNEDVMGGKQEKYQMKLIADLLNNTGPDLMVMDDLPLEHYIQKGILEDIGTLFAADPSIREEDYFMNIVDNMRESDGGLYILPLSFYLHTWIGNHSAAMQTGVQFDDKTWTWDEFMEVVGQMKVEADEEVYGFSAYSPLTLLYELIRVDYMQFIDISRGEANFDSEVFYDLLNRLKELEKNGTIRFDAADRDMNKTITAQSLLFVDSEIRTPLHYFQYIAYHKGQGKQRPVFYERPKTEGQQAGGYFEPRLSIAMNAKSSHRAEAWDFLKYLMSGEASSVDAWGVNNLQPTSQGYEGMLPTSKKVYQAKKERMIQDGKVETFTDLGPVEVTAADIEKLEEVIHQSNKRVYRGAALTILLDEMPAYFSGQKTAEAVAKIIQNKVTTSLNE